MQLHPHFREFLQSLNENRVKYLVVGGYAVGFHGYPRSTADLDIWVKPDAENAVSLVAAMRSLGFEVADPPALERPDRMLGIGVPPVCIEIMTSVSGVTFDDCYGQRDTLDLEGLEVPVIDRENLRKNKLATGRHKDLADVENLFGSESTS